MGKKMKKGIRKSVRNSYILILLIIIIVSLFTLYDITNVNNKKFVKTNIYEYNNKFTYSYDVNLIENDFITKEDISDGSAYVTDLIDNVIVDLDYNYDASKSSNIIYTYQVIGNLEATYSKDGIEQKVWKKTDVLIPMKEANVSSDKLEIKENLNVNLKEKIETVKEFQQSVGIQVQAKYTILMEIVTDTNILGQSVINPYSPDVVFEIGAKTTSITTNVEDTAKPQVATKMINEKEGNSQTKNGIVTVIMLTSVVLLIIVIFGTKNNNIIKNEYKIELNKILKNCQEKIVAVKEKIKIEGQNLVNVNQFDEIIKVSEELAKPILYWNNENEEESWFCVAGDNIVYRYVLKR